MGGGGDDYSDWVEAQRSEDHTRAAVSQNKTSKTEVLQMPSAIEVSFFELLFNHFQKKIIFSKK